MPSGAHLPVQSVAIVEPACTPLHTPAEVGLSRRRSVRSSRRMSHPSLAELRDLLDKVALERADPSDAALLRAVAQTVDHIRIKDEGQASAAGVWLAKLPTASFRMLLRERRKAANLSLRQLAKLCKISPNTIRNIENGKTMASDLTAARLARVPELALLDCSASAPSSGSNGPNCYLLPSYDRRAMIQEMQQVLGAPGGRLEQTCLYLDDASAGDYLAIASSPDFQERFRSLPLDTVATSIIDQAAAAPLDLVALGPGDGRTEIELAKALLRRLPSVDVRLQLLDISHTLLTLAYARARAELPPQVTVEALHGDFRQIFRYPALHRSLWPRRRRCYALLGCTLANVDSEVLFVRDGLSQSQPGDMAVLDFQIAWADRRDPEAIRQADPLFKTGTPEAHARWFSGPLLRYGGAIDSYKLGMDLLTDGGIDGSYEIDCYADAVRTGAVDRYHLFRVRRYQPELLLAALARLGWQTESCLRYGPTQMSAVALLRRA